MKGKGKKEIPGPRPLRRGEVIRGTDCFDYGGSIGLRAVGDHWLRGKKYYPGLHQRIVRKKGAKK